MPRPGPRPYECVRRAWHSDRHQPIRGSLIQELFRVANEIHCAATRKNKEWQQKLPFVVLKAEEIMYSKANSEAEYVDLGTLLERANDAIDTIIRKEDSDESGDLLQPCIEAALNLGCVPRRASRSERHNSPRCYLSSSSQEHIERPINPQGAAIVHANIVRPPQPQQNSCPFFPPKFSHLGSANCMPCNTERRDGFPRPCMAADCLDVERSMIAFSSLGCVYPLYYPPSSYQRMEFPVGNAGNSMCDDDATRDGVNCCLHNFLGPKDVDGVFDGLTRSRNVMGNTHDVGVDLSLRLGPPLDGLSCCGRSWVYEAEDVASNSSYSGSRL